MEDMPCDVCGSYEHADHIDCSYCGSSKHVEHPVCAECGSYSHAEHPVARCGYCGSYDHEDHPRCRECGDYEHEIHPRCPVCSDDAHTNHEEGYLKGMETDAEMYWTTLRVFTNKLEASFEELKHDAAWRKVKRQWVEEGEDAEEFRTTNAWQLAFDSTIKTLAAVLKVDAPTTIGTWHVVRGQEQEDKPVAFARDLLAHARGLLTEFDAIRAQQSTRASQPAPPTAAH